MQIAEDLISRLKGCGLTQNKIAAGSGVPQTTVSRVMRGHPMRLDTAEMLIKFLDGTAKRQPSDAQPIV